MCLGECVSQARFVTYGSDVEELDGRLENAAVTESITNIFVEMVKSYRLVMPWYLWHFSYKRMT